MRTALDFVSKTTGRIHLKAAFDTAPEGLTREDAKLICKKMRRFQKELQKDIGLNHKIELTLDSYEGSVFWYLVLFRPVLFGRSDPIFGGKRTWSVYEIIEAGNADSLGKTDLGVIYDQDRLILIWPEAYGGILDGIEKCPSWKRIIKKKDRSFWKKCADSFSFTIPRWQLRQENLLHDFWQRQGHRLRYDDVSVMSLNGVEVPSKVGRLPVAKKVKFAWFYDKPQPEKTKKKQIDATQRQAARTIYRIFKLLKFGRLGRPWDMLTSEKAAALCEKAVLNFTPTKKINWVKVEREISNLLELGGYETPALTLDKISQKR